MQIMAIFFLMFWTFIRLLNHYVLVHDETREQTLMLFFLNAEKASIYPISTLKLMLIPFDHASM